MLHSNQTNSNPIAAYMTPVNAPAGTIFQKEMSLTMDEFTRAMPKAVQGIVTQTDKAGLSFRSDCDQGTVFISCRPKANRELGSLSLPRMTVEIQFCNFSAPESDDFFNRFALMFLRMGG